MQLAVLLYEHLVALDAVGPYEVLSRLPGVETVFVAEQRGPVRCDTPQLALVAEASLSEVAAPDIVVVPGWSGARQPRLLEAGPVHEWLRLVDDHSTWTASSCTGSLILASAGLLHGRRATTHWLAFEELAALGAVSAHERVVFDGKYATAAGVTAGIDMALALAARVAGDKTARAIQLGIEYDPQPPFESGSPAKAAGQTVETMRSMKDFILYGSRGEAIPRR